MVVDTSALIELLARGERHGDVRRRLPPRSEIVIPTIVQLELTKWMLRYSGADAAARVLGFTATCRVESLTTTIAARAAVESGRHKLSTADAIVYATARHMGLKLLTCDAHFEGLEDVVLIDKRNAATA
jgi:predicted nucleic acid-binding protein